MDVKLVLQLSLFGLAMAVATVYWIPPRAEPLFWAVIFTVSGLVIARGAPGRPFVHGLLVGLVNSVWVTAAHVLLFDRYIAGHPREAALAAAMGSPRLMMAVTGPVIGLVSGCVIGFVALAAAWTLQRRATTTSAPS